MEPQQTYETAIVPVNSVLLGTLTTSGPRDIIQQATNIATQLAHIVNSRNLFTTISGKKFVLFEGWSTLGAMLGILPREVEVIRHEDGTYEATVEIIRTSDGSIVGRASAICGTDEPSWKSRPNYARRSMAITRASGKAFRLGFSWIMALAGYEPTPAEEMDGIAVNGEILPRKPPPPQRRQPKNKPPVLRPLEPDKLKEFLHLKSLPDNGEPITEKQTGFLARKFQEAFAPSEEAEKLYHMALQWLWGVDSSKKLTKRQAIATLNWLLVADGPDDTGDTLLHEHSSQEANAVYREAMLEQGQQELVQPEEVKLFHRHAWAD